MSPGAEQRPARNRALHIESLSGEIDGRDDNASQPHSAVKVVPLDLVRRCAVCGDFTRSGDADRFSAVPACRACAWRDVHQALRREYIAEILDDIVDVILTASSARSRSMGAVVFKVDRLVSVATREALAAYLEPEQPRRRA